MIWHEDDHPRDGDGKFTEKGNTESKTEKKEFRQNASYDEIIKADRQVSLSKQEWAQYYKRLGEIKAGLLAKRYSQSGRHYVIVGNKAIFDNDSFVSPHVYEVVEFETEDDLFEWLE